MAAQASDPLLWVDDLDNTPPLPWEALEADDRWWFDANTYGDQRTLTYVGDYALPDLLEFEVEITEAADAPYSTVLLTYTATWEGGSESNSIELGSTVGTYPVSIDTSGWGTGATFSWKVATGWEDMYGGVAAVLGPYVPAACFDCVCDNTNSTLSELRARLTTALGFKAQLAQQTGVTLSAFRTFLAQRLGFAATADNLPPGAQELFDNFVNDAQQIVWRQYAFDAYGAEAPTAMVAGSDTCTLDAEAIRLFALMLGKGYYGKEDAKLARDLASQYLEDLTKRGPPNLEAMLTEKLQSAQTFLYFKYPALRTRYIFRWEMEEGVRFYGLCDTQDNPCDLSFSPYKNIEGAWLIDLNGAWLPMASGIPPAMYTTLNNRSLPTRYEIRQCLEVFPAPSASGYQVAIKGHFGLLPFAADEDKTTIDSELVFLWALYEAKLQYRQTDAAVYSDKARERIGDLTAGTHGSRRYIPGTRPRTPAVMPVFEES